MKHVNIVLLALCGAIFLKAQLPSREYVYAGDRLLAIENSVLSGSLSPLAQFVDANGQSGVVNVTASGSWQAGSTAPWLSLGLSSGAGSYPLNFSVQPNDTYNGNMRRSLISVNGAIASVTQRRMVREFLDMSPDRYDFDTAHLMRRYNITTGCSTVPEYCPSTPLLRWMMAVFFVKAWSHAVLGSATAFLDPNSAYYPSQVPYFSDVSDPTVNYFPYVQKMFELGITSGCALNPRRFCPDDTNLKYQTAVFAVRTRQLVSGSCTGNCINDNFSYPTQQIYSDVVSSDSAFKFIQKVTEYQGASPTLITPDCTLGNYCQYLGTYRGEMSWYVIRSVLNDLRN